MVLPSMSIQDRFVSPTHTEKTASRESRSSTVKGLNSMPDQRVLSIPMLLIMTLFALGCGSEPQHAPTAEDKTGQTTSAEEQANDSPGQLIADLPSDIRDVASPDISVPKVPTENQPEKSDPPESERRDGGTDSPERNTEPSGGQAPQQMSDDELSSADPVTAQPGSDESSGSPPETTPEPAGSVTMTPDRKTIASAQQSAVTSKTVIQRDSVPRKHKGFSSELVYFATNREPSGTAIAMKDPDLFFGDERGDLSYGVCEVSIPYKRTPGTLPEPSVWSLEFTQDPQKHVVLMEIQRLPDADFWMALRKKVDASPNRQLMLFVHGYSATFRDAARRTAQMAYDMNYQGPAMFFSWPAGSDQEGIQERANYLKDLRRAEASDEELITVIESISRWSGAKRVHLVAHSMGNFILTEALKTIDDRNGRKGNPPRIFDQVVMAAPDLDAKGFVRSSGKRLQGFSRRITVYASRQDKALKLSKSVNGFEPLGLLNEFSRQGAEAKLYELVDASTAESGWFDSGHIYYGDMPEMLVDLAFVFRGIPATSLQRGLGETPPLFRLTSRSR
jgi:esterase/lipase superfamily enzyme